MSFTAVWRQTLPEHYDNITVQHRYATRCKKSYSTVRTLPQPQWVPQRTLSLEPSLPQAAPPRPTEPEPAAAVWRWSHLRSGRGSGSRTECAPWGEQRPISALNLTEPHAALNMAAKLLGAPYHLSPRGLCPYKVMGPWASSWSSSPPPTCGRDNG